MRITGGPDDETLTGSPGDDVIDGGGGADTMIGLAGNDIYYVDDAGDQVIEAAGGGSDNVYAKVSYGLAAGQEVEFLRVHGSAGLALAGNELANYLIGGSGSDTLDGGDGNDTLDGRLGADAMTGGSGNDFYYVDDAGDQVIETAGGGSDNVHAKVSYTLAAGQEIEFLRAYGSAGLALTGNELANYLIGGSGSDTLAGGDGNDRLDGRLGADAMAGGSGNDVYYVDDAGDQVIEAAGGGSDNVHASVSYTLAVGQEIEFLRVYGSAGLTLTGNELANYLIGGSGGDTLDGKDGDDTLNGGLGADTMAGGSGNDRYYVDDAGDQVIEAAGGGSDNVYASVDYTLAAGQEIEFLRVYGSAGLALTGNELANYLIGGSGNDTLDGGLGADVMAGGSGNDTYSVDDAADRVVEAVGGGSDTVLASVNYVLRAGQEVETLQVRGSAGLALTGNEFANRLIGGSGNDTLDGGAGADVMAGGDGDDSYRIDDAGDQVIEAAGGGSDTIYASIDYTLAAGMEVEILSVGGDAANIGHRLTGNDFGMRLYGGAGDDTLTGGAGDDVILGGGGRDVIDGGAGADIMVDGDLHGGTTFYVDNAGDRVEAHGATIYTSVDWIVGEDVSDSSVRVVGSTGFHLTDKGSNRLYGGAGDDTLTATLGGALYGGDGNDTLTGGSFGSVLDGGAGADIMIGSASAGDTYYVDNAGDRVFEGSGYDDINFDTVHASVDFSAAGQGIEYIFAVGDNDLRLTASDFGTRIYGGDGNDTLTGGNARDGLYGGAGDDTLIGGYGFDIIDGGDGNDTITAYTGQIEGGDGDDTIQLASGGWDIDGGSGFARVDGGSGNDILRMSTLDEIYISGIETLDTGNGTLRAAAGQLAQFDNIIAGSAAADTQIVITDNVLAFPGGGGTVDFTTKITGQQSVKYDGALAFNVVNVTGTVNDDWIIGGSADDRLDGGAGDDVLTGGNGNDVLTGGGGGDTFVFDQPMQRGSVDTVADFAPGADIFHLDHTAFAGFALGSLAAAGFSSGAATGSGPQIVYNRSTGDLFYDGNGAASGGATQFASVAGRPILTAADFVII